MASSFRNLLGLPVKDWDTRADGQILIMGSDKEHWEFADESGGSSSAASVTYDHTTSGLTATDVQAAIDEVAAAGGGGVPAPAPARYWRIQDLAGFFLNSVSIIEFRHSLTGATLCTGGTASASTTYSSYSAANAFDGNSSTFWAAGTTGTQWVGYDFGVGNEASVQYVLMKSRSGYGGQMPQAFSVQSSNDSSTWTEQWRVLGQAIWANETRIFGFKQ